MTLVIQKPDFLEKIDVNSGIFHKLDLPLKWISRLKWKTGAEYQISVLTAFAHFWNQSFLVYNFILAILIIHSFNKYLFIKYP